MWSGLDLLFPPACGGCGKTGQRWCDRCRDDLIILPEQICEVCGEPLTRAGMCSSCLKSRPPYRALRSWVVFKGPIRTALHKLKYRRDLGLGEALAWPLAQFIDSRLDWEIEMIVPIPLSPLRLEQRGYNQVALIAQPLAMLMNWEYCPKALHRVKNTRSQVGLSPGERRENVQNAFSANPRLIKNRKILLMDDVATTGATLSSASKSLLEAGSCTVYALTAARAVSRHAAVLI